MRTESLTVRATYEEIRRPSAILQHLFTQMHVAEEVRGSCELALHELLTNLVDHAYAGDGSRSIKVKMSCDRTRVLLETMDTGTPPSVKLDQVSMPNPTDLAEGGYGLAIIQQLMDEVRYQSEHGRNIWQLVKYF